MQAIIEPLVERLGERLGPGYWWNDPTTAWNGTGAAALAVPLAAAFIGATMALVLAEKPLASTSRASARLASRAAWTLGYASTGLLLLLFRWQMPPFFGRPIWFILWAVSAASLAALAIGTVMRARGRIRSAATTHADAQESPANCPAGNES